MEKVDKKGFVMRADQREHFKNGPKGQYTTEEKGFDGCWLDPVLYEKE